MENKNLPKPSMRISARFSERKLNFAKRAEIPLLGKLIVILGPTASGKTELAIKLAKKLAPYRTCSDAGFNGVEIISADSRQVYKGMNIGTAKPTPDTKNSSNFSTGQAKKKYIFTHKGIPHYCIDVASPKRRFTVAQYRKLALKAIEKIQKKGKIPILVGGTWFYIRAVVDGLVIPEVPPDWKLRKKLEKKSAKELFKILKKLDPQRAKKIEKENPRRLIRAIEISKKIGKVPPLKFSPLPYPVLMIGIKKSKRELEKIIKRRFFEWLKRGLILEVIKLRKMGVSFKRIEGFGMHYREIARYLQGKISEREMIENSIKEIQNYAKRQTAWFKRDKRIKWIKNYREAEKLVKKLIAK
jgi:tRNA dimethylallyltransferase